MLTVTVILIVTVFIVLSGKSYAYLEKSVEGSRVNLQVGTLDYNFVLDEDLKSGVYVKAKEYKLVNLELSTKNKIESKYQFVYENIDNIVVEYLDYSEALPYGMINKDTVKNISIRIYNPLDKDINLDIYVKGGLINNEIELEENEKAITVKATDVYQEEVLNGADPVLTDNLIPVIIDEDGTVEKASIYSKWYEYERQVWANAVVLKDDTIEYKDGNIIPEDNIESYFVWIPKYSYKLWDLGNYNSITSLDNTKIQSIGIKFGLTDTSDSVSGECTTPGVAGETGNCAVGEYMTHPAFQAFDSNGFWVGKFESGYNGATSTSTAEVNSSETGKLVIKPNVYSWRNITIGNAFKVAYDYMRNEESHMMKNTEWGAVAYLQHSMYGSRSSVRVNNNSAYITGYAATVEPTLGYNGGTSISGNLVESTALNKDGTNTKRYNTPTGYTASTTNNISGVYDMSGGAHEYVMGYNESASSVGGSSGLTTIYGDFFMSETYEKYYDKYKSTSETLYSNRILGDATGEMGPFWDAADPDGNTRHRTSWYGDYAHFVNVSYPWFYRGGRWYHGIVSGVFNSNRDTGDVRIYASFRVVLTP